MEGERRGEGGWFECGICGRGFWVRAGAFLRNHQRVHEDRGREVNVRCEGI